MNTILFYGDSNTYGYDPRGFGGGRYPAAVRWTDRLRDAMQGEWRILVNAMNGREIPTGGRIPGVREMLRTARAEQAIQWFAVMLGTNDLFSVPDFAAAMAVTRRMDAFLRVVQEDIPECKILLTAPPKMGWENAKDPTAARLFRESRQLSLYYHLLAEQRGYAFASAWDWDLSLAYDGVHLTEEANMVFAREMKRVLDEIR